MIPPVSMKSSPNSPTRFRPTSTTGCANIPISVKRRGAGGDGTARLWDARVGHKYSEFPALSTAAVRHGETWNGARTIRVESTPPARLENGGMTISQPRSIALVDVASGHVVALVELDPSFEDAKEGIERDVEIFTDDEKTWVMLLRVAVP